MSSINLHTKEINVKIVYYGPGLGGKTTTLQYFHRTLRPELRGQLVSLATGVDRTLYFDFLPVKLPAIKDFTIRLSLYTVPGQVHYNATRKLVLQGCDGVVLVADSQPARQDANIESLHNLEENLRAQGMNPDAVPTIIQYNKRDLPNILPIQQMHSDLNTRNLLTFETCALTGLGVFDGLKAIAKLVLADLKRKGIYRDRPTRSILKFDSAPVVRPSVEEGLVKALEKQRDPKPMERAEPQGLEPGRGLTFSQLWPVGPDRDQILAMEGELERGDFASAVRRADGLLRGLVGGADRRQDDPSEALLMLGVYGGHYARYRQILSLAKPTKQDATFCLFFLADIELRMQSTGLQTGPDSLIPGA